MTTMAEKRSGRQTKEGHLEREKRKKNLLKTSRLHKRTMK